jgi:hypothetical protein
MNLLAGKASRFIEVLFAAQFRNRSFERLGNVLAQRVAAGGYPAVLLRSKAKRRAAWSVEIRLLRSRFSKDAAQILFKDSDGGLCRNQYFSPA